jgi:hypothetical protein
MDELRATPAVAPKVGPLLFIWVLLLLLGVQNFCFHSNHTTQMKAPKSKLAKNGMWNPLVIGSNISFLHPPHRGQDAKEMRALGVSGQCLRGGEEAAPELRTDKSTHVCRSRGWPQGREERCRYRASARRRGSTLETTMVGVAPAHQGGDTLTGGDEGEAYRWRSRWREGAR